MATILWENIVETVDSETTNRYARSCNGAFSLSFVSTIMNSWHLLGDCVCRVTCEDTCSKTKILFSGHDICLSETCSQTYGLVLGILYIFRFDFFTLGNCYSRLIRRKGLLIPFVSISLFFCRSNWLPKVNLSNKTTAFHKLSKIFSCQVAMWAPNPRRAHASKQLVSQKQHAYHVPVRC